MLNQLKQFVESSWVLWNLLDFRQQNSDGNPIPPMPLAFDVLKDVGFELIPHSRKLSHSLPDISILTLSSHVSYSFSLVFYWELFSFYYTTKLLRTTESLAIWMNILKEISKICLFVLLPTVSSKTVVNRFARDSRYRISWLNPLSIVLGFGTHFEKSNDTLVYEKKENKLGNAQLTLFVFLLILRGRFILNTKELISLLEVIASYLRASE